MGKTIFFGFLQKIRKCATKINILLIFCIRSGNWICHNYRQFMANLNDEDTTSKKDDPVKKEEKRE